MAVWCHRLDMAVSDLNSSRSLIRARHQMGVLLAYFLGRGTAWRLTFEDVVAQVLKENCQQLDAQCNEAVTSLHHCNQRWALLHREIDASAMAQELTANTPEGRELAVKLMALWTTLGAVEKAMMAHETLIEECRMQEEEAHQAETFHEEPEEELLDEEMVEDDDRDDPEPSGPHAEAGKEDPPPPLEEANLLLRNLRVMSSLLRRTPSSCSQHCYLEVPPPDLTAPGARPVRSRGNWLG